MADVQKILEQLLGKPGADTVHAALDEAQKTLDDAGIKRKDDPSGDAAPADDAILAALETAGAPQVAQLVKNILDALKGDALTALEEKLGSHEAVVTLLLKAVSGAPETPGDPGEIPVGDVMVKTLKSLTDYVAASTHDMGEIARSQVEMATAVKTLTGDNAVLRGEFDKLKAQLDDRPRQASRAAETAIDEKDGKKLETALQKGLGEITEIAGIRVRNYPGKQ